MGIEHDDHAGIPVPFRPLFVELPENRVKALRQVTRFVLDPVDFELVAPLRARMFEQGIAELRAMAKREPIRLGDLPAFRRRPARTQADDTPTKRMRRPTASESAPTVVIRKPKIRNGG
jgi:hypothetical protein